MKKSIIISSVIVASSLMVGCNPTSVRSVTNAAVNEALSPVTTATGTATGTSTGLPSGSSQAVTYKNDSRNYSFTIPAGWAKQQGDVNTDSVLFMKVPIKSSCSFQIHSTRMRPSFPAETSVRASLKASKEDITIDKLISAKRRDESGLEKGKKVRFTRGWEIVEKAKPNTHQRIIYQAYDRENYMFNMMAAAGTPEKFKECEPELRKIIDSIKFGD